METNSPPREDSEVNFVIRWQLIRGVGLSSECSIPVFPLWI